MLFDIERMGHTNLGTIIADSAALFLLVGIIIHTTIYRRRGRTDDRLFFCMVVADIVAAVSDGICFALENSLHPSAGKLIMAGDTVFSLAFVMVSLLFVLFLDYRLHRSRERLAARWPVYAAPMILTVLAVIGNLFFGYMFTTDAQNMYHYGDWYNLIFIAPAIYCFIAVVQLWKIRPVLVAHLLIIIGVRVIGGFFARGISTTALVYAVGLAFVHIVVMNEPFYAEEGKS